MVDPIQRTSSVPVPASQTSRATQDPLPVNSSREQDRVDDTIRSDDEEDNSAAFEDYLNQTAILTLEKAKPKQGFDPAGDIESASTYSQPGQKSPI